MSLRPVALWSLALAACGGAAAPEVVLYTSVDQSHAEPVIAAFEAATGIRVKAVHDVEASKTTGLVTRLVAERAAPIADVYWSSEVVQTVWLQGEGVLAPYASPAAADLPGSLRDPDGHWAGMGLRARVILVNTERVAADAYPTTVFDLVDARWPAGEVAVANPLFGTTFTHAAALYASLGPEGALAFFDRVKTGGPRVVDGNATVRDLVARGEVSVGLTDSDDAAGAVARGAPVAVVLPARAEDGALFIPGTVALVAGGPHPEQGRALVDWLLSGEAEARLIADGFFHSSVRAAPPGAEVSWPAIAAQVPRAREELRALFLR